MGRPCKKGIIFYQNYVEIFSDRKIKRLIRKHSGNGFLVYEYLKSIIYKENGYYIQMDDDLIFDISMELFLEENEVQDIINTCCDVGLFDCDLMDLNVISSRGIQLRYEEIIKKSKRVNCGILPEYDLISSVKSGVSSVESIVSSEESGVYSEETTKKQEESTQNKIKENKIEEIYRPLAGFDYEFEKGKSGFHELLPYWESVSTEIENQVLEHQIAAYLAQIDARAFAAQYRMTKNELKDYLQRWAAKFMEQNDKLAEVQIKIKSFQRYLTNVRNNKK